MPCMNCLVYHIGHKPEGHNRVPVLPTHATDYEGGYRFLVSTRY